MEFPIVKVADFGYVDILGFFHGVGCPRGAPLIGVLPIAPKLDVDFVLGGFFVSRGAIIGPHRGDPAFSWHRTHVDFKTTGL